MEVYGQHHDIFGLRATFLWMLIFIGDISPCINYLEPQAYVNYWYKDHMKYEMLEIKQNYNCVFVNQTFIKLLSNIYLTLV